VKGENGWGREKGGGGGGGGGGRPFSLEKLGGRCANNIRHSLLMEQNNQEEGRWPRLHCREKKHKGGGGKKEVEGNQTLASPGTVTHLVSEKMGNTAPIKFLWGGGEQKSEMRRANAWGGAMNGNIGGKVLRR